MTAMSLVFLVPIGYLGVALACALYNLVVKAVGGIEYEARAEHP